jgi:putative ATP-dependent endonuclease of the OLD family
MKILCITIHNYRSILHETIQFGEYSLLIGANNSGKSNIIDAVRTFYEKDIRFEADRDFPKFQTEDRESWIEIEFLLTREEALTIKHEYLVGTSSFRIRKWFYPSDKAKLAFIGYENGKLAESQFYGWKNVGQAKLGNVVYVPAISRLEDHTKLSGPSALRELVNDILKPIIRSSAAFATLASHFKEFGASIREEQTVDKRSLKGLEEKINEEIKGWGANFNIEVATPQEDEIVKTLIRHTVTDSELGKALAGCGKTRAEGDRCAPTPLTRAAGAHP